MFLFTRSRSSLVLQAKNDWTLLPDVMFRTCLTNKDNQFQLALWQCTERDHSENCRNITERKTYSNGELEEAFICYSPNIPKTLNVIGSHEPLWFMSGNLTLSVIASLELGSGRGDLMPTYTFCKQNMALSS